MIMQRFIILLGLNLCAISAFADTILGVEVPDDYVPPQKEEVKEAALQLPSPPNRDKLIPIYVDESFNFKFAIDPDSLTFGKDGILRYTVAMKSNQGATTILYEGIRCWGHDAKRYAEWKEIPKGGWFESPNPKWQHINAKGRNNYRFALFSRYWCHPALPVYSVKDMITALKDGGHEGTETEDWPY